MRLSSAVAIGDREGSNLLAGGPAPAPGRRAQGAPLWGEADRYASARRPLRTNTERAVSCRRRAVMDPKGSGLEFGQPEEYFQRVLVAFRQKSGGLRQKRESSRSPWDGRSNSKGGRLPDAKGHTGLPRRSALRTGAAIRRHGSAVPVGIAIPEGDAERSPGRAHEPRGAARRSRAAQRPYGRDPAPRPADRTQHDGCRHAGE